MAKLMKEILCKHPISMISVLGEACQFLSLPTGSDKEQRAQGRQETAHRNPSVKHSLTIRVVSSAYLRLLIFLPAILIPAGASSSPAFLMMHSAYKLNKEGNNIQPSHTPFPILSQSVLPHKVLTVAS